MRSARRFRCHDEDALAELATLRHDQKGYISRARQRIRMLEDTLLAEHQDDGAERDAGEQGRRGEGAEPAEVRGALHHALQPITSRAPRAPDAA